MATPRIGACFLALFAVTSILSSRPARAADAASTADIIEKAEPCVVRIDTFTGKEHKKYATGSGFVVDAQGIVMTNHHVIAGASDATATFKSGKSMKVLGTLYLDADRDIAILKLDQPVSAVIQLAPSAPRKGETVVAIGAPVGLDFSASEGIVAAVRPSSEVKQYMKGAAGTWVQTTAPISPGNSGGPLVNRAGQVVGANTWGLSGGVAQNLNFAISSTDIADALRTGMMNKLVSLPDGAAKAKSPDSSVAERSEELAVDKIPARSIEGYVESGRGLYRIRVADNRKELREVNKALRSVRSAQITPQAANAEKIYYSDVQGERVYYFPDKLTKDQYVRRLQKISDDMSELVKKMDDTKRGFLNFLTSGGPGLEADAVGNVGYVPRLIVAKVIEDEEFGSVIDRKPVVVRGIKTTDLADRSELPGRLMYVAATMTLGDSRGSNKVFVVRELPAEIIERYVPDPSPMASTSAPTSVKTSKPAVKEVVEKKEDEFRTWTDKTGKFKVEATVVSRDKDQITMKRRDGSTLTIEIAKLSQADQDFLNKSTPRK